MNKENTIKKINKYGKIGKIITRIAFAFLCMSAVITLIASFALRAFPKGLIDFKLDNVATFTMNPAVVDGALPTEAEYDKILDVVNNGKLESGFNLGAVKFVFDKAEVQDGKIVATSKGNTGSVSLTGLANALAIAVVSIMMTAVSIFFGSMLCKAFENCSSPFDDDVIKKMRNFAISLIPWSLLSSAPENAFSNLLNSSLRINLNVDFNVIFAVLVILALTVVFKYGAMLQQESDETL